MIRTGEMVRRGGGPVMRVADIFNDMARCILVDGHGRIGQRFHYVGDLTPLWLTLQPKSLWPDPGQLDALEIEREERAATQAKKIKNAASKKAKASRKIKRRSNVPA
jgi:hypothetical protein